MIYAGTIIEISNNKTYVFTMDYSIVTLKTKKDYFLGQQITFTKRDKYIDLYLLGSGTLKTFALAAAAIILITTLALTGVFNGSHPNQRFDELCTALVSVDINPSIEISINKDDQIVEATAVNEDGIKVLEVLNLKQKSLIDGINEIVSTAKTMGYIDESKNVVLVSAALFNSITELDSEDYAGQLKEILSTLEGGSDDATVLTVFIEDSTIIEEAKNNNLSIGKELLYEYAKSQDNGLTADDIRTTGLNELLDKFNAVEKDGQLIDTLQNPAVATDPYEATPTPAYTDFISNVQVTATPIPVIELTPTLAPEPKPTEAPKPIVTTKPTVAPKPTKVPIDNESSEFKPNLTVSADGETINFTWTELDSSSITYNGKTYKGFYYYKVVASADNPNPIYPDDGYLTVISDQWQNEWSVTPSEGEYNYSPELYSGKTYYFSITYVFENGKFTSDTETLQVPDYSGNAPEETVSSLALTVSSEEDTMNFSWTPLNSSSITYNGKTYNDFSYYKVVASQSNPNPKYPEDGYLTYLTDCYEDSWSVTPSIGDYNYSPELISGETYYFSITYVFGNGKLYSNTVQYTVP